MTPAQVKTAADDLKTALEEPEGTSDATDAEINENTASAGLATSLLDLAEVLVNRLSGTGRCGRFQRGVKPLP
jgi:hypothetical protein